MVEVDAPPGDVADHAGRVLGRRLPARPQHGARRLQLEPHFDDGGGTLDLLFTFSGTGGDLGGDRVLPSNWIADFRRLYNFIEAGRADLVVAAAKLNSPGASTPSSCTRCRPAAAIVGPPTTPTDRATWPSAT